MPFVEGRSLRDRLTGEGSPPLQRAIGILRDVARALAYAHEHDVVHRDIKPDNILLSGDAAIVTDFGIAKAVSAARTSDSGEAAASTVTVAGMAVGTPAYMAPEQIAADPDIDHRADLYSFGCLAYEMLAGAPPYHGVSLHGLFTAHLSQPPVPIGEKRPDCPPAVARLVMQCLEKDPANRPATARDVLGVLDASTGAATGFTRFRQRLTRRQRLGTVAGAVMLLAGAAGILARGFASGRDAVSTIAVVPFLNETADSSAEYLADGLADGVATALGRVTSVRVVSRSLSYRYKGRRSLDSREVGRALAARFLVHGALREVGGRRRMSVQLTSTRDNSELWSRSYDEPAGDALALQDSITRSLTRTLDSLLGNPAAPAAVAATGGTADAEAYDLYLRGRFLLQRRGPGVRQSIEKFEQALAKDSSFARAHAALAFALELLPYFEPVHPPMLRGRAVAAAERALSMDSTLAEAHTALAMVHQHEYRWQDAEREFRRALVLESGEVDSHIQWGRFLFYTGRPAEARAAFERARETDPYSAAASAWVGHLKELAGQPAAGLADIRRALDIDSTNPPSLVFAAQALDALGRRDSARAMMERLWRSFPQWQPVAAWVLAGLGEPARARAIIAELEAAEPPPPLRHSVMAILYIALGDTAAGLDALERATARREIWPTYYSLAERDFDRVRRSARFAEVVRTAGLDARVFTAVGGGRPR
jgi:serine/threonine-protein kinase